MAKSVRPPAGPNIHRAVSGYEDGTGAVGGHRAMPHTVHDPVGAQPPYSYQKFLAQKGETQRSMRMQRRASAYQGSH